MLGLLGRGLYSGFLQAGGKHSSESRLRPSPENTWTPARQ